MIKIVVRNVLEYRLKVNKAADNFRKPKRKVLATNYTNEHEKIISEDLCYSWPKQKCPSPVCWGRAFRY
jgi:hypothetical protein